MKKILFLLLSTVASYGQAVFDEGVQITGGQTTTSTTSKILSQEADGTLNTINATSLPVSTATQTAIDLKSNKESGLLLGGGLSVNADPTKWDLAFGEGYVSNSLTGVVEKISWGTQSALTTPYRTTSVATYVLMANAGGGFGTITLQNSAPTPQQYRTHIYLGKLAHTTFTTILFAVSEPSRMFDVTGQVSDINKFLGSGNIEGNAIAYNGANLNINASAGMTYRPGANYLNDRNSPSITTESSFTAGTFRNKFRNGSGGWSAVNTTTIDPNYYDDGTGILAVVPNNKWTIKVFWRFGGTGTIHCDYGQTVYDSKAQALEAVGKAVTAEDPETKRDASKRGWLVVKQGITVLNDITTAEFLQADKFGERAAGGSSTATMQTAYNNSVTPQITTSTGLGAVAFKRGSAADTDNALVVQNGAGSDTFSVKGNGAITGLTYNGYTPESNSNKATDFTTVDNTLYPSVQAVSYATSYKRTISQIRAFSGTLPNNNFYTTDLGQEGDWYYDSTDVVSADNTGTVLVTSDGKRIKRIIGKEVLAKWFGLVSDGSTDNKTALQNAVSYGLLSNLPIIIPSGNYLLSSSLNVSTVSKDIFSRVEIKGEDNTILKTGFVGSLLNITGSVEGVGNSGYVTVIVKKINFNNAGYTGSTAITVDNAKTVILEDIYIYGGYTNGVSLKSTYANSKISNVRINGCTNAGIISLGQVNNIRYEGCAFLGCNYGFYASPLSGSGMISGEMDTNTFSKCDFEVNSKSIYIDSPQPFQNLSIIDNHFESNTGDEITINNYTSLNAVVDISGLTISGNLFSGAKGVQVGNSNSGGFLDAVSFNNNRFATNTPDTNSIRIGSECADKNRNVIIFNNNYYADGSSTTLEKLTQAKLSILNNVGGVSSVQAMYKITPEAPSSSADTKGVQGDLRYSDNYLIFKTATGWKKSILNPFDVTGTSGYLPIFTPTGTLEDSQFYDNGTNIGIGTNSVGTDKVLIRTSGTSINGLNIYSPSVTNGASIFLSDNLNGVSIKSIPETGSSSLGMYVDGALKIKISNTSGEVNISNDLTAANYTGGAALTGTPTAPTATAGTNTTQIATTAFVQTQASGGNYTPTLTNTANITSSSLTNATYTRIGDIVTVNLGFSVDPTAANTNTVLTITLPISRTVSTVLNSGSGAIFQSNTRLPANFQTSANTTQGVIYIYPSSTGTYAGSVTFQYNIN